ncbi:MAG: hypothetical protein II354_03180 [Firmicutes bacterium]|nr:hypothetical protein [Bacillota bacterium]
MQENYELVQRGFRILLGSMSGFIGQEINRVYRNNWWNEVLYALNDQRDLPSDGNYADLVDSLDIANCIRLIDRKWNDVFRNVLPMNCRTWARELMGVRNIVAHIGQQDLEQLMAERALDTMALLCNAFDPEGAEEIREVYHIVRAKAGGNQTVQYSGLAQPEADSDRTTALEKSLLHLVGTDAVQKTTLTRKVTYGGKTEVYPVYKVRLDLLYYNDQNDRIATWISQYEAENGKEGLSDLNSEIYNRIIENFISESNPEAIVKTQKNISLVGQREPGVTLADGRIVDGNRRFTCLRRLQRESQEPVFFETVIMEMDIQADKKKIKLLELAIQHGEEKKVDYDLIDYAVGTYRDVVQTGLLTVEEYAQSTNETVADVKKRIEVAGVVCEFLSYINLPEQYHVAREYQVYSLFQEMMPALKTLNNDEKQTLKAIAFNNTIMSAIKDQRKFIRDIRGLIKNDTYGTYFEEQKNLSGEIAAKLDETEIRSKEDLDRIAGENNHLTEQLKDSIERALLRSRTQQLKNKPSENVRKSVDLLMDIDPRLFGKMGEEDKEELKAELLELERIVMSFRKQLER